MADARRTGGHAERQQSLRQSSVSTGRHPADETEREKNRALLKELKEGHLTVLDDLEHLKASLVDLDDLKGSVPQIQSDLRELRGGLSATIEGLVSNMLPSLIGAATRSMESENASLKQQLQRLGAENQRLVGDVEKMRSQMQKAESGLNEIKDFARTVEGIKQELQSLKKDAAGKPDADRLKSGAQSKDALTRVQSKLDITTIEFHDLRKKIFDRGLLAPPRVEPINEESPPVGTVELCEDVFTAQLLMRLSFDRQALTEAAEDRERREKGLGPAVDYSPITSTTPRTVRLVNTDESDSDGSMSLADLHALEQFGNVSGIGDPEEGVSRAVVIPMWTAISFITLIVQIIVVLLMMQFYIMSPGCFEVLPEPFVDPNWWVLHISRGLAMFVCGAIMTRDFMDSLNYLMTSMLLEPRTNPTVVVSFLGRVLLNVVLLMANVYLYMSFTGAGELWVNMACLGFIATLDRDVCSLARRGVFGHHISKAVTGISYELTFLNEYPAWFPAVSKTVISICTIGVACASVACFLVPDRTC